ncbi:hypothetical protein CPB97_002689, partial [Podila verticillata]
MEDHQAFVNYMVNKGYEVILSTTEADIKIATDCKKEDVVITGDSDLLIYKSIPAATVLNMLHVTSTQLVALAIISGNDYMGNIPMLSIKMNHKLIKKLEDGDETCIVQNYLALPEVIHKTGKDSANDC